MCNIPALLVRRILFPERQRTSYVITSGGWGGASIDLYGWTRTPNGNPSLALEWSSTNTASRTTVPDGQDAGVFTSTSSNAGKPGSMVIWAVSRPTDNDPSDIYLYAFDVNGNNLIPGGTGLLAGTGPIRAVTRTSCRRWPTAMVYVAERSVSGDFRHRRAFLRRHCRRSRLCRCACRWQPANMRFSAW
jgi:hypothetical protein